MRRLCFCIIVLLAATVANAQTDEDRWVDSVFNSLTLEQRVGQLVNVRANNPNQAFMPYIDSLVIKYNIGGVTFFRTDADRLLQQANQWQSLAQTPMMVAIDAEWGLGMRLNDGISYPFQMTLGAIQNRELIADMGQQISEQCRRLGINVNFAPDVDVNNEPTNPVIGMRSFGDDPQSVAELGTLYALALQRNGVLPTMKHFPGHGDTKNDSHLTLPVVDKKLKSIQKTELYPFKYLIGHGVKGAMVGHLYMPALEPVKNTSSSLSKTVVTDLLKNEMGFDGIIFTDALDMKGAYVQRDPDSVGLRALMAGDDVLLMPLHPQQTLEVIVAAAHDDYEVYKRVEESCKKILRYKYRLGLVRHQIQPEHSLYNDLHQAKYDNLKQRLYNEAVTMLRNRNDVLPLDKAQSLAVITFGKTDNMAKKLKADGYNVRSYLIGEKLNKNERQRIIKELGAYNMVIVSVQNTSIFHYKGFGITAETLEFVKEISAKYRVVFDLFACPYALNKFDFKKDPAAIIIGYEDNPMSVNAVVDVMTGRQNPIGRLPVSIKKYKKGDGLSFEGMLTPETLPVELVDNKYTAKVDSIALDGIAMKAYPGCQIFAMKDGKVIYDKCFGTFTYDDEHEVQADDVYDIASLTKVFATTFAIMKLYDDGKLSLESKLGDYFPYLRKTDKGDVTLIEIMTHQAGLTSWIPLYKNTIVNGKPDAGLYRNEIDEEHTVRVAKGMYISDEFRYELFETIKDSPMAEKKYKYSDMGFYYMPKIVEMITNMPFEKYLEENFYKPLNLNHIFYKPLKYIDVEKIAPTENDTVFRMQLLRGDVHDQAAALMGGVSGHAGLFAAARDLAVMMQLLLDNGYANNRQFLSEYTIRKFTSAPFADNMNRRGIGFDKPEVDPSVPYYTPAKQSSMRSFGHTGFTGTFAWADPENNLIVIFLSNRVYPDASNNKLSQNDIRTKIHEAFYEAVK